MCSDRLPVTEWTRMARSLLKRYSWQELDSSVLISHRSARPYWGRTRSRCYSATPSPAVRLSLSEEGIAKLSTWRLFVEDLKLVTNIGKGELCSETIQSAERFMRKSTMCQMLIAVTRHVLYCSQNVNLPKRCH